MSAARAGRRSQRSAWRPFLLVVLGAGVVAFAISRIDFGEAIKEITLPLRHDDIIRHEAHDEDVAQVNGEQIALPATDAALLAAVIYAESRFRDVTSTAGARGLMQITPDTADTIEGISGGETFEYEDLADPDLNIRYGSFYLRYLLHRFEGNEVAALGGCNAGPDNAEAWGGSGLEVDDIEFPETREYVESVLVKRDEYRENYADELGL
jgi:soluble lytic murein transglycosylase